MNDLFLYLLKSGICLLVFYLLYALVLQRETCFQYNRFYLLSTITLSFLLPQLALPFFKHAPPVTGFVAERLAPISVTEPIDAAPASNAPSITPTPEPSVFTWEQGLLFIYALGCSFLTFQLLRQLYKLHLFSRQTAGTSFRWHGILVSKVKVQQPTFSFGNRIFLNDNQALSNAELERILLHEAVHVRQKHTWDIMYLALLKIVFWFNPLLYLYQKALISMHEYIADAAVLQTTDQKAYARLVLKQLFHRLEFSLGNHFNKSLTLKRMNMMKQTHRRPSKLKQLLALPVLTVLTFMLSSSNIPLREAVKDPAGLVSTLVMANEANNINQQKFSEPLFPGGKEAMYDFFAQNMKYPAEGLNAGDWGMVLTVKIDEKGVLEAPKFMPRENENMTAYFGSNDAFDKEIHRVLNAMPRNWTPATIQGKPVPSRYIFNFMFDKLNSETKLPASAEQEEYELDPDNNPVVISKTINVIVYDKNIPLENHKSDQPKLAFNNPKTVLQASVVAPAGSVQTVSSLAFDNKIQFPLFPGGRQQMYEYLRKNVRFAEYINFLGSNAAGAFTTAEIKIDEKGRVTTESFLTDDAFAREINWAIRNMPPWQPAEVDGRPTAATYNLTFFFQKDVDEDIVGLVTEKLEKYTDGELNINAVIYGKKAYTVQNNPNEPVLAAVIVETKPEFPGGIEKMYEFLGENVKYPAAARDAKLEGMVIAKFIVTKAGKILETKIEKHLSPETDAEILRVIELMPFWIPGKQNGQPVNVEYTLPFKFRLNHNPPKPTAQNNQPDSVYKEVEQLPQFPGGLNKMYQFLGKNIKYPAARTRTEGTVVATFIVTDQGKIKDLQIEQSVSPAADAETLRVIKLMPDWEPGKQAGKPVHVEYKLPIRFTTGG